jgi:tagatose-1,6-bisphosphate aldolase
VTSPGRRRGLAQLATPRGAVALALLTEAEPATRSRLCAALAPHVSAVCLDPAGAAAAAADGSLPGRTGLAIDLGEPARRGAPARFAAGFSPASARRVGASAGYLRLPLRADREQLAERAVAVARRAAALCHDEELPLVLQVEVDPLPGESVAAFWERYDELSAAALARLAAVAADLLVLPLAAGRGATRPWICGLQADDPRALHAEVAQARDAGAVGVALGASLWGGVVDVDALLDATAPLAASLRELLEERPAAAAA